MTNSGAFKGYALDFAETFGLDLPALSPANAAAIKKILPPFAAIENPVDTTAQTVRDPSILGSTAAQLLADPAMGASSSRSSPARRALPWTRPTRSCPASQDLEKPIAVATMGDETELPAEFSAVLREKGLAFFRSPDRALRAMARATWYGNAVTSRRRAPTPTALPPYRDRGDRCAHRVSGQGVAGDARHRRPGRRAGARSRRGARDRRAGRLSRRLEGASRRAGA